MANDTAHIVVMTVQLIALTMTLVQAAAIAIVQAAAIAIVQVIVQAQAIAVAVEVLTDRGNHENS